MNGLRMYLRLKYLFANNIIVNAGTNFQKIFF